MTLPWALPACSPSDVQRLVAELGLSPTCASVLVRRGYGEPEKAKAFLDPRAMSHDARTLGDVDDAVALLRGAVESGARICVHGDYDVDGICATAVAYTVLRDLGANVRWFLPSRFVEGYGLRAETIDALADDGVELILTVDCGIGALDEVRHARERGIEMIVTDHHQPPDQLPECPIVATRPSEYPFPELCGTGVAYKLMEALAPEADLTPLLELVAMATIADVVPLVDENRALSSAGLARLSRTTRPGLKALMKVSGVDPAVVDAGAVGFRLAPRLNAAGRLGHPETALQLLLAPTREEALKLASECERLNRERQAIEDRMLREALAQIEEWPADKRDRRAYVLWGEDWHVGVIGIVASRLVERFHRPVVLIAGSDDGWRGSGRSIPAFDLFAGLAACAPMLEAFGGHRAAAGLTISPEHLEEFAELLGAIAAGKLEDDSLSPVTRLDAVVHGDELTLELCAELQQLAPFGLGNPGVTLLAPACELVDITPVGDDKHLKMGVVPRANGAGRVRSGAIAFGFGDHLDRLRQPGLWDVVFRLEANRWNGSVSPQLVVKRIFESVPGYLELRDRLTAEWRGGPDGWSAESEEIFRQLCLVDGEELSFRMHLIEAETFTRMLEERAGVAAAADLARAA